VSEVVAIVSVSASAVVGLSGVVVVAWSGSRERRWQSGEERAIEFRAVLEDGGSKVAQLLLSMDEARTEVRNLGQLSPGSKRGIGVTDKSIVLALNRVGVRRGSQAPEYRTLGRYWLAVSELSTILEEADGEGLNSEQQAAYSRAWDKALSAENAYLDATAKALRLNEPLPRRHKLFARSHAISGSQEVPPTDSAAP
jgi:hypothetical protein